MEFIQSISVSQREEAPKNWTRKLADSLSRIRFQLFGGILFAIVLPFIARTNLERFSDAVINYEHSLIGTACALLLGYLIFRKMTILPGARAIVNVVPAFMTSYAVVVAFFFLLRIDYSRLQFLLSFALTCFWFAAILFIVARFRRPVFCVLPGAGTSRLLAYKGIRWKVIKSQKLLKRTPHIPLIADFGSRTLDPEWERMIAEEAIKGRRVLNAKDLAESLTGRVEIDHLSENSFGHLAPDSLYAPTKR